MAKETEMDYFIRYFANIAEKVALIDSCVLTQITNILVDTRSKGGKVFIFGNGGSAAIASHVAVDLTKTANIRTVAYHDIAMVTCFSNDYGFENWIAKTIELYADKNDMTILISSSGKSPNILNAAVKVKQLCLCLATFSGFSPNNPLKQIGDINCWVDSMEYNIVELTHSVWLSAVIDNIIQKQTEVIVSEGPR